MPSNQHYYKMTEQYGESHVSPCWVLIQWNDYRKENFAKVIGVFTSLQEAKRVQSSTVQEFKTTSWMKTIENLPILQYDNCLFVDPDYKYGEEPERMCFEIFQIRLPSEIKDTAVVAVSVEWRGWGGSNRCAPIKLVPSAESAKLEFPSGIVGDPFGIPRSQGQGVLLFEVQLNKKVDHEKF